MDAVHLTAKLKALLLSKASVTRIDHSKGRKDIGFFWDHSVLKTEASMEAALATHLDFVLAVIREGIMLDITPTMCQDAVDALDAENDGQLYCETFGSKHEWLRNEGSCLKKLLGLVRLKESRLIDCSRQGATVKLLVQEYRQVKQQQPPQERRRSRSAAATTSNKKAKLGQKSLWEMSQAEIRQAMSGGSGANSQPSQPASLVEDLCTPQVVKSDGSSEEEGCNVVSNELEPNVAEKAIDKIIYYHDYGNMKWCRTYASGRLEIGEVVQMDPTDVFVWFGFPDGTKHRSEFPVKALGPLLPAEKVKKPSVRKRPASRMQSKKTEEPQSQAQDKPAPDVQPHSLVARMFPSGSDVGSEKSRQGDLEVEQTSDLNEAGGSEQEAEEEFPKEVDHTVEVTSRKEKVLQLPAASAPRPVAPAAALVAPAPPKSWARDWQAGAKAGPPGPDGRVRTWTFSNAAQQGQFVMTYARDQTYLHLALKGGGRRLFLGGLSCGWNQHQDLMADTVSELLALEEAEYVDAANIKKRFLEIRDKLKSGRWIENSK